MSRAVLSLGSNVGDRTAHLQTAVRSLGRVVRAVSSIYRTPPWGGVEQQDFYNIVVIAEDDGADPHAWWRRCQALEQEAGRERTVRWGPRTLDADVILVEVHGHAVISDEPDLILPHPRAAERAFVLMPWAEVDPGAELPGGGPIADLLDGLDTAGITRVGHVH
ncbi:2-amino-4-hydroxy-6-hydroxymethyldihydropteridine diphosphokinase [Nakamurella sp.]|uniref:2-amino-4-hydroxy-6- hydroxymethyldihydropteridine diphosphokinase n=1 Tax=Nakamurella sp. TaxID=1869182 RepID=UPI00378450E6